MEKPDDSQSKYEILNFWQKKTSHSFMQKGKSRVVYDKYKGKPSLIEYFLITLESTAIFKINIFV